MEHPRVLIQKMGILICCLSLILILSTNIAAGKLCHNRIDIVIAVDTTSSETASSFENVKTEVKGIVSGFTIGHTATRLALVSISKSASVVVNFNAVNSLSDFNGAVDSLTYSTDTADLSSGIKVAKDSVLNTARVKQISKILILVKDRRFTAHSAAPDTAMLSRVTSEAAGTKALGAVIQAIGIGGLWKKVELVALYGTDYLMFKNKNKALDSAKSLNNIVCEADCPNKGTTLADDGLCYESTKHVINTRADLVVQSSGLSVCRKSIERKFVTCAQTVRCNKMDRKIGPCRSDGKVTIESMWQSFNYKLQSCVTTTTRQNVDCADSLKCIGQVADVIFLLDRSGSIRHRFPILKEATRILIDAMNIGVNAVRVGIVSFNSDVKVEIQLGSLSDKSALLRAVQGLSNYARTLTHTHQALEKAREIFASHGRAEIAKFAFLITDGESTYPQMTFAETAVVKNAGITLYAIGVGYPLVSELETMTAPETDTNMLIVKDFNNLKDWTQKFSKRICIQMSAPNPKLCDDKVFVQSVSECTKGKQQITKTEYKYNVKLKCIKATSSTMLENCKTKCIDPIDGNEYIEGTKWSTLCHQFHCSGTVPKPFLPHKSQCLAADGSCKDVGSQPFKCRDAKGLELNNCQCIKDKTGNPALQIETE